MRRAIRILVGCYLPVFLLLIAASCATSPRRHVSLESARKALQLEYPALLQGFDLHQGTFTVQQAIWDTLATTDRTRFLKRCSQSRWGIVGSTAVTVRKDDGILATYDGATPVFYSNPFLTVGSAAAVAGESAASSGPTLIEMPNPIYPSEALQAGIEGTVSMKVLVGTDGHVRDIVVVGDGIAALNDAAVAAASAARFRPAIEAGAPISMWVQIPLRFSILGKRRLPLQTEERGAGGLASSISVPSVIPMEPGGKTGK